MFPPKRGCGNLDYILSRGNEFKKSVGPMDLDQSVFDLLFTRLGLGLLTYSLHL